MCFSHDALFYAGGDEGFVSGMLPAVEQALAHGGGVLVAVCAPRAQALRGALAERAELVRFADEQALARNPARLLELWWGFAEEHAPGSGGWALGISEPLTADAQDAELEERSRHEQLLAIAFAHGPAWRLLCAYDLDALGKQALASARHAHPARGDRAGRERGVGEQLAAPAPDLFAGTLPAPPPHALELDFSVRELSQLRGAVSGWAAQEGLGREGVEELVLAVDEIAANSIRHGGGSGTLSRWRERERLLCQVSDSGRIVDPLVGRMRPPAGATGGRGVWIANQLCDLVQIRSSQAGTNVRLHKLLG